VHSGAALSVGENKTRSFSGNKKILNTKHQLFEKKKSYFWFKSEGKYERLM